MSDIDIILTQALANQQSKATPDFESVVWNALMQAREIIASQKRQLNEKDQQIAELRQENTLLRNDNDRLQTALKNPRPPSPNTDPANDDDNPSNPSRHRTKKKCINLDSDVIGQLKKSSNYAVVCDKALDYWQLLANAGLINERLMPTQICGVTTAARIVCRFQTVVDERIKWSFFERRWHIDHLQSNLRRTAYKDEKYYPLVNRLFGLPDDAPYISKRNIAG